MMKQHWYDKGFDAFVAGHSKLMAWDKGAKYFNEGWEEAARQDGWDEEVDEHSRLVGDLEDLKKRICGYGESLDLDELTKLLYEMGARA
tara:strand:- start:1010 stop:1276 length:267 start_codon:yes stop_codon:yes gene_type:complete